MSSDQTFTEEIEKVDVIDLIPFRIVTTDERAFVLPNGNGHYPGVLVLPQEPAVVSFDGCFCTECRGGAEEVIGFNVSKYLYVRGYKKIHFQFADYDLPDVLRDHIKQAETDEEFTCESCAKNKCVYLPKPCADDGWFVVDGITKYPKHFNDTMNLVRWLLSQPQTIFQIETKCAYNTCIDTHYMEEVALGRILTIAEKFAPDWNPTKFLQKLFCLLERENGEFSENNLEGFVLPEDIKSTLPY